MKQDEQGKYIELQDFVKAIGLAASGGQAKVLIRSATIMVDDVVETRLRRKLRQRMTVTHAGKKYLVNEKTLR